MKWDTGIGSPSSASGNVKTKTDPNGKIHGHAPASGVQFEPSRLGSGMLLGSSMATGTFVRDDARVIAVLETYLEAILAGNQWSRDEFLAEHSEIAEARSPSVSPAWISSRARPASLPGATGFGCSTCRGDSPLRSTRGIPDRSRGRPWWHGCCLRGRTGLAGPARCPEGATIRRGDRPQATATVSDRGPGRSPVAPPPYRADLRSWLRPRHPLLRDAIRRGTQPAGDSPRSAIDGRHTGRKRGVAARSPARRVGNAPRSLDRAHIAATSPGSVPKPPTHSSMPTASVSSIATSSRPTS